MNSIEEVWRMSDGLQREGLLVFAIGTFAQTLFVLIYASRPWWRVRPGRALLLKSATLCAVMWLSLVATFFVYPYQEQVTAVAVNAIAIAIVYQLVALLLSPRNPS